MRAAKGTRFMHILAETGGRKGNPPPVFSEGFLYERIGKDDARFVLGVAEEYETLIAKMGSGAVYELLEAPERKQAADRTIADALFAARSALNEAAASLCENCRKGIHLDNEHYVSERHETTHRVWRPKQDGEEYGHHEAEPCQAAEQRKALDRIYGGIHWFGSRAGIETDPTPHEFDAASTPPEPWCKVCWLGPREDCHDKRRIEEAQGWKQ